MYYVEIPDTFPRAYERVEQPPARGHRFEAVAAEVVVHSKMHGSHDRPQPYVLRGVARGGRLLVQTIVGTEYDPAGRWHEVDAEYTVEGYRFKRHALKPILTLIKLATTAAKTAARAATKRDKLAVRDEKVGTCPCCFGDYVVHARRGKASMVHHGYQRPGHGYIVGDCYGVGREPFEISCEGTKSWLGVVKAVLQGRHADLAGLDDRDEIVVDVRIRRVGHRHQVESKTLRRGDDGFDRAIAQRRFDLTTEVDRIEKVVVELTQRIAEWAPAPWPRVGKAP